MQFFQFYSATKTCPSDDAYSYCDYYNEILASAEIFSFQDFEKRKILLDRSVVLLVFMINSKYVLFLLGGLYSLNPSNAYFWGVRTPRKSTCLMDKRASVFP